MVVLISFITRLIPSLFGQEQRYPNDNETTSVNGLRYNSQMCCRDATLSQPVKQRKKKSSLPADQTGSAKPLAPPSRSIPHNRLWAFRFIALLFPLFVFLLLEAALHLFGFGHPTSFFLRKTINGQNVWIQ